MINALLLTVCLMGTTQDIQSTNVETATPITIVNILSAPINLIIETIEAKPVRTIIANILDRKIARRLINDAVKPLHLKPFPIDPIAPKNKLPTPK